MYLRGYALADSPSSTPAGPPEDPDEATTRSVGAQRQTRADSNPSDFQHGRFEPGHRLGSRYRIVGLLGSGGMGEVYRADDLELGQSVALKFLPQRVVADELWLTRFRNEVRTAREIAHPNVCRMYDIAETDGHVFLSMEYIDGEDLSGVLRRLGRPSREKAIEIARQICLGLAAAHENGVLHRDLKPANIMIDGRGRVRITDFGLAGFLDELQGTVARAGTPAYMAPEQLAAGTVSVRSDVYSLGLILYELFTGSRVHDSNNIEELKRSHSSGSLSTPSSITEEIDPAVERVIMRCFENEPEQRPQSVYQVLAALPGGDPLAAALAAGELPSPELVANAGARGGLSTRVAVFLAAWIAVVTAASVILTSTRKAPEQSGVVLMTRAVEILRELGYGELPANTAWGFTENTEYLTHLRQSGDTSWSGVDDKLPATLLFWCRWSPSTFYGKTQLHDPFPSIEDPPQSEPGSITMILNDVGRLVWLDVEADPDVLPATDPAAHWDALMARAGLTDEAVTVTEAEDAQVLPTHSDEIRVWDVNAPEELGGEFVAEAGAFRGRPVHFALRWNWQRVDAASMGSGDSLLTRAFVFFGALFDLLGALLWPVVIIVSAVLAARNVRAGRGDRSGSMRTGLLMAGLYLVAEVVNVRFGEQGLALSLNEFATGRALGHTLLHGFQIWLGYLALEPYVRQIWPRLLVAWVRLMSGRWDDPLVGREVLVGMALGTVIWIGATLTDEIAELLGLANFAPVPNLMALEAISPPILRVWMLCLVMTGGLLHVMYVLIVLLVARVLTRRTWAAALVAIVLFAAGSPGWYFGVEYAGSIPILTTFVWALIYAAVMVFALLRFGMVCAVSAHAGSNLLGLMIGTLDLRDWYAGSMVIVLFAVAALVIYGVWVSLEGRPIFRDVLGQSK